MRRGVVRTYDDVGHRGVGEDGGLLEGGWVGGAGGRERAD